MKWILGRECVRVVEALGRVGALLAFDFDGTLAPIVARPAAAVIPPHTRDLLRRVAALYPVAVISGRSRDDVARRLRGIPVSRIVGNHGLEPRADPSIAQRPTARWLRLLEPTLHGLRGVVLEDKGLSLAIHYRGAPAPGPTRATILRAAQALPDARLIGGKRVLNVLPLGGGDKASALAEIIDALGCVRALYVGDDDNDEDAFALRRAALVTVRVGRSRHSRAKYFLRSQAELQTLLARLLAARADGPARGRKAP